MNVIMNHQMGLAWRLIANTSMSVFLTGKAGTGKTTFLRLLRQQSPKRMVVLAPTGVAAINAEGQTIHSFFQLPFGPIVPGMERESSKKFSMSKEKKNLIRTLDLLVIDEVSMVRCDLLDAIDAELRKYRHRGRPFGGVQLLLIGDLQQLAPVVKENEWQLLAPHYQTQYFFGSKALQQTQYVTVELQHIYRQQDAAFIELLGKIRENRFDAETLRRLNERVVPNFNPPKNEDWIRLTTHNRMADDYNQQKLSELQSKEMLFVAETKGNFPETSYPAEKELVLKTGAQVMFIKNDPTPAHDYYNGKIGVVEGFTSEGITVYSKEDGQYCVVPQAEWENTKFVIDEETKAIKEEVEGVFRQYPLRLAWAITVHKSQGLTFEHAVLDIHDSFAHGQAYVALSRCRTLEGMVLSRPIDFSSVITDMSVNAFINNGIRQSEQVENYLPQMMRDYFLSLLSEAFSFDGLYAELRNLHRIASDHLYKSHPIFLQTVSNALPRVEKELQSVANRFAIQYRTIIASLPVEAFAAKTEADEQAAPQTDEKLQQRINAASNYFFAKMSEILAEVIECKTMKIANKQIDSQFQRAMEALELSFRIKSGVFGNFSAERFSTHSYLTVKAHAALDEDIFDTKKRTKKSKKEKQTNPKPEDPELFEALRALRTEVAREKLLQPYLVFSDKTLHCMASERPSNLKQMLDIHGVGETKLAIYGQRFLDEILKWEK